MKLHATILAITLASAAAAQTGVRAFERGCGPVATWPRLEVTSGTPKIGTTVTLTGSLLKPSSPALTLLGVSNTRWGSLRLPLMVDARVFPPCQILVSVDVLNAGIADTRGRSSLPLPIPNAPGLVGQKLYFQMISPAMPWHMTSGIELTFLR